MLSIPFQLTGIITIVGLINDAVSDHSLRMKLPNQRIVVITDIGIIVCSVLFGILVSPYKLDQLLNLLKCFHKVRIVQQLLLCL